MPRATCLVQALSTQILLGRHGHAGKVHIGVALDPELGFRAHAWVESQGKILVGDRKNSTVTRRCWFWMPTAFTTSRSIFKVMATEISLNSRVRIQDDVLFQELKGEAVLLNLKTGVYLGLNQLGTRIWQLLQADGSLDRAKEVILREYDVTPEKCAQDLLDLVQQMEQQGLVSAAS